MTTTNRHAGGIRSTAEDEHDELFSDAQAWCDGANSSSMRSGKSGKLRNKLMRFSNGAKRSDGSGELGGRYQEGANVYNDTKLSRAQPWRLRYPTPHDLKEQLSRGSASDDGA